MKRLAAIALGLILAFGVMGQSELEYKIIEEAAQVSVKVESVYAKGSGVLFTRKDWTGTNDVTLVWTAGHVVEDPFTSILKLFIDSEKVTIDQKFEDVDIINGDQKARARVIAYDPDQDLALLALDASWTNSVSFQLGDYEPRRGQDVFSVTAPHGMEDTYSKGNVSFVGRDIEDINVFDQVDITVWPGSSGGPLFTEQGTCIGLAIALRGGRLTFFAPIRRIEDWAASQNLLWALDPNEPMISEEAFKQLKP